MWTWWKQRVMVSDFEGNLGIKLYSELWLFHKCLSCVTDGKMDLDRKRNKKTMLDENGQYPVWMNQRQAKKIKGKRMPKKGSQGKKKKGIAWWERGKSLKTLDPETQDHFMYSYMQENCWVSPSGSLQWITRFMAVPQSPFWSNSLQENVEQQLQIKETKIACCHSVQQHKYTHFIFGFTKRTTVFSFLTLFPVNPNSCICIFPSVNIPKLLGLFVQCHCTQCDTEDATKFINYGINKTFYIKKNCNSFFQF